jgi:hypothetical protein
LRIVDPPVTHVQQYLLRPTECGSGCTRADRLVATQQLCKPAILPDATGIAGRKSPESLGDGNCAILESSTMDGRATTVVGQSANISTADGKSVPRLWGNTRANEKQEVAPVCLENIWRERLQRLGWSERAVTQAPLCWAESTLHGYNRSLNRLQTFCGERQLPFPPVSSAPLADIMCATADSSARPASQLRTVQAAVGILYAVTDQSNVLDSFDLHKLGVALTKSGTKVPMTRTSISPIKPFRDMFMLWSYNDLLPLKDLRLKVITLLALTVMLRPSDVAPKGKIFDAEKLSTDSILFTADMVTFLGDGSVQLQLHGIKNDTDGKGFTATVPCNPVAKLDPVASLQCYMERTREQRADSGAVFVALSRPFIPIGSATVASFLLQAIELVGLSGLGYTAKSFRPTAATAAVKSGCDPKTAMQVGRWKTESVFYEHYVHARPENDYTERILDQP